VTENCEIFPRKPHLTHPQTRVPWKLGNTGRRQETGIMWLSGREKVLMITAVWIRVWQIDGQTVAYGEALTHSFARWKPVKRVFHIRATGRRVNERMANFQMPSEHAKLAKHAKLSFRYNIVKWMNFDCHSQSIAACPLATSNKPTKWKSVQRRHIHCALAVVRRSQKFSSRRRPLPGGAGRPKFNQLEMITTFTFKPSLERIDACNFELSW